MSNTLPLVVLLIGSSQVFAAEQDTQRLTAATQVLDEI